MPWLVIHRVLHVGATFRRALLFQLAVLMVWAVPMQAAAVANAAPLRVASMAAVGQNGPSICSLNAGCPTYAPAPLLHLDQAAFAATSDQATSLAALQNQAVANIIARHGLTAADANAVKTWARSDAQAELYALLVDAVTASKASRTADQQNAVDWLSAVLQRQSTLAAESAGLEYVKWAGLDQSAYNGLLARSATQSDLQAFLSGTPLNYNNTNVGLSTGGWCSYRSPAPYGTEYTGYSNPTCPGPCPGFCNPPTPSYDQLVKWGSAVTTLSVLNSAQFARTSQNIGAGLGIGVAAAAAGAAGGFVGGAVGSAGFALMPYFSIMPYLSTAAVPTLSAAAVLGVATFVIVALTTAVIQGITVVNAAALPGQLASLIANARTTVPDPAAQLSSSSGKAILFSLFVAATLPEPVDGTCDTSSLPTGVTVTAGSLQFSGSQCLNPTPIPTLTPARSAGNS